MRAQFLFFPLAALFFPLGARQRSDDLLDSLKESLAAVERLSAAKSLKCVFGEGYATNWDKDAPTMERGRWSKEADLTLIFDSINLRTQSARAIANQGAGDVGVLATASGLTFIEQTAGGNVVVTTVFPAYKKGTKDFIAVHSRHWFSAFPLGVLPSQYHGTCSVWNVDRR
jgi:hypothetical protein